MRFLVFGLSGIEIRLYTCFLHIGFVYRLGLLGETHVEKKGSIPLPNTTMAL
jgi:hypothetical protein